MLLTLFVLAFAPLAVAQDTPRVEVFGGYSFRTERRETNQDFGNINGLTPAQIKAALGVDISGNTGRSKLNGFEASITGYFGKKKSFGVTGDVSGHYKTETQTFLATPTQLKIADYNLLAGPQYKFRRSSRVEPFVHALFGVTLIRHQVAIQSNPVNAFTNNYKGFGMALGGGLDWRINNHIAFRVFPDRLQPDLPGK
jgi:opacity protein-like surface antigen